MNPPRLLCRIHFHVTFNVSPSTLIIMTKEVELFLGISVCYVARTTPTPERTGTGKRNRGGCENRKEDLRDERVDVVQPRGTY